MDFEWNPIVEAVAGDLSGCGLWGLSPQYGLQVETGTTIMLQSHHINTTDTAILVNDRFDIHLSPADDILYAAAPIELGDERFSIPEGFFEYTFDCTMDEDFHMAWIAGHMHEYGAYQYIDRIRNGESKRLYGVETWLEEYYLAACRKFSSRRRGHTRRRYPAGHLCVEQHDRCHTRTPTQKCATAVELSFPAKTVFIVKRDPIIQAPRTDIRAG